MDPPDHAAPHVSVALCTHNGEAFVREQVRSICAQTFPLTEIVLSDDASGDATVALVQDEVARCVASRAPALRILRNDRALGVAANFEQALRACSGDLIALSDQDDVWHPERIERMVASFAARADLLLLHSDARLVDREGRPLGQTLFYALEVRPFELAWLHGGKAFDVFLRRNLVTGATAMLDRRLLAHALPIAPHWLHDEWLGAVAATVGAVDVVEAPLIDYRQHGANLIGAQRLRFLEGVQRALAPRGTEQRTRAQRAQAWLDRLDAIVAGGTPVEPRKRRDLVERLAHQRFRAALPSSRLARLAPVWREMRAGHYGRFGRGVRGVVRDLLESA